MAKAARAFRIKLSQAVMLGDGQGKPQGILHAGSGIPICDVASTTPPGEFTWTDLVQLKFQLPEQYAARGTCLMNGRTLGMVPPMTPQGLSKKVMSSSSRSTIASVHLAFSRTLRLMPRTGYRPRRHGRRGRPAPRGRNNAQHGAGPPMPGGLWVRSARHRRGHWMRSKRPAPGHITLSPTRAENLKVVQKPPEYGSACMVVARRVTTM